MTNGLSGMLLLFVTVMLLVLSVEIYWSAPVVSDSRDTKLDDINHGLTEVNNALKDSIDRLNRSFPEHKL